MSESSYLSFGSPMALSNLYPAPPDDSGTVILDVSGSLGISGELLNTGGLASRMLRRIVLGS
eukprot:scaffold421201_cov96-Attheya_sp.AAC.1